MIKDVVVMLQSVCGEVGEVNNGMEDVYDQRKEDGAWKFNKNQILSYCEEQFTIKFVVNRLTLEQQRDMLQHAVFIIFVVLLVAILIIVVFLCRKGLKK